MVTIGFRRAALFSALMSIAVGCSAPPPATEVDQTATPAATGILIDGSSTVFPITDEVAKEYQFEKAETAPSITVEFSGTGGGFAKFCAGETDVSNASRPITTEEMEACREAGIEYIEIPVAFDALTVVVPASNTWAEDITLDELKMLWEPGAEGEITRWSQIRSEWPDEPITLYGPGQDSGTFDYFTEAVVGESGASRTDYTASEDDTELVRGVRTDTNGLGYFGYAYYEESVPALRAIAIDGGNGPVLPSDETVRSGEYQPLARPLLIYVSVDALEEKPELQEFLEYYLTHVRYLVQVVGYVPLPEEAYALAMEIFQNKRVGTVFGGESRFGLTIEQLMKEEAEF